MEVFLLVIIGLYLCFMAITASFARIKPKTVPQKDHRTTSVSVIVPARNEEKDLPDCLRALAMQNYPADLLEIIVANDHSEDRTGEIVRAAAVEHPVIRPYDVPESTGSLRGKPHAAHAAIQASTGSVLLMTDADCRPPTGWVARMVDYFEDDRAGMVCGLTHIIPSSRFSKAQAIDWMVLQTFSAGFSNAGIPVTAMGNNMGIRRKVYDDLGGFEALPFSVTEDYALFRAVVKDTPYDAGIFFDPLLSNRTLPLPDFRSAFKQHQRWTKGALAVPLWIYGLHLTVLLTHVAIPVLLFLNPIQGVIALILKIVFDGMLFRAGSNAADLPERRSLSWFILDFELYFWRYVLLMPLALLFKPTIQWKSRSYSKHS